MKLRKQNSRSERKTRIQFSSVPQVAPRHRGSDCQIRWSVSVGSLFIITVASVNSSSDSKTLQPWLPLLQWLPKILKNICEQTVQTENTIILCCMPRLVASHGARANPTPGEARRSATFVAQVFPLELPQMVRAIPPQDLSCGPARRPWRHCSHDRPYLALRARQAWPPSLAPPPVPLALPRRAVQLHAIGVLHRATGPTPDHSFAGASKHSNLLSRSGAFTPVSMSLTRLARRPGTAVGWTMPMSSVLL